MTKGTVWTEPTPVASWLGFHLTVLIAVHLSFWALSMMAFVASPPDALNAIIFVYAILLAVPTFAYAGCLVVVRVTSRSGARPNQGWRRPIAIGTSIAVGLHALAALWMLGFWLAAG